MTIGIYQLIFKNTDKSYIGQSKDIEYRFKKHLQILRNNNGSIKLQEAYNKYGAPTLHIISICTLEELDTKENEYISKYNSVDNGFNTYYLASGSNYLYGEDNIRSYHSNEEYIKVFKTLLAHPTKTYAEISELLDISQNIVSSIARGSNHKWLKDKFPEEYLILLSRVKSTIRMGLHNSAKALGKSYPIIQSPIGELFNIENIRQFALLNNLDRSDLGKVLRGQKTHVKGYKLYKEELCL